MQDIITFQREDCMHLSFPDESFDAVTSAYGVRNFQDLDAGLSEIFRVLRKGGHLLIVELCTPLIFLINSCLRNRTKMNKHKGSQNEDSADNVMANVFHILFGLEGKITTKKRKYQHLLQFF